LDTPPSSAIALQGGVPGKGTFSFFREKLRCPRNHYYHKVYVDSARMYVPGRSPKPRRKTKVRRLRLWIWADDVPIRNVIAIARQYEAYLKEPGIDTYRQSAEHFST